MKLSDSIKYSFLKTIRDKKNIYFVIILVICCLLATGAISFSTAFFSELKRSENSNISSRSLFATPKINDISKAKEFMDENISKLEQMEQVLETTQDIGMVYVTVDQFKSPIHSGGIELIRGSENTLPQNVIGDKFTSDDTGVAICPINFFPGNMVNYPKGEKDIFINGYDILNRTFEASVEIYDVVDKKVVEKGKYKKNFKVIGLYNPDETSNWLFQCFVPSKDIAEIYYSSMGKLFNTESLPSINVLVDKYENLENVKKEMIKMGFEVDYSIEYDTSFHNSIKYTCALIVFLAIICVIFITTLYIKKRNTNSSYELGILKSLGYPDRDITTINTFQIVLMSIISYLISTMIFITVTMLIRTIFKNYLIYTQHSYYLNQYLTTYLISLVIILILPMISSVIYTRKIINNKANYIIRNDNL